MVRISFRTYLILAAVGIIAYCGLFLYFKTFMKDSKELVDSKYEKFIAKIDKLEVKMDKELEESRILLEKIQEQLAKEGERKERLKKDKPVIAILVIACNRVTVTRCLDNLLKYRPNKDQFPIIVSQDCNHAPTYEAISRYVTPDSGVTITRQPNSTKIALFGSKKKLGGYYYISRHYKYALEFVFDKYEQVIIVEDDLDISPDFYEYFQATLDLLIQDKSLWCISAFNDNGKRGLIDERASDVLYRTDFFPGLGWMLRRDVALELLDKWPLAFWDDWVRDPEQRQGRACIRPEISRTITFGKIGVSNGLYFEAHLKHIILNEHFVPFTQMDLSYLLKENYDPWWDSTVSSTKAVSLSDLKRMNFDSKSIRVVYNTASTFKMAAKALGLMDDFRSGVPRMAYRGVVPCQHKNAKVYITRDHPVTEYDPKWS